MENNEKMRTEGFMHTLTPLCVYDEVTPFDLIGKESRRAQNKSERIFEVVGVSIAHDWDTYYLLQIRRQAVAPNPTKTTSGQMAFAVPMRHRSIPVYALGDFVRVGYSERFRHFYIERTN